MGRGFGGPLQPVAQGDDSAMVGQGGSVVEDLKDFLERHAKLGQKTGLECSFNPLMRFLRPMYAIGPDACNEVELEKVLKGTTVKVGAAARSE